MLPALTLLIVFGLREAEKLLREERSDGALPRASRRAVKLRWGPRVSHHRITPAHAAASVPAPTIRQYQPKPRKSCDSKYLVRKATEK